MGLITDCTYVRKPPENPETMGLRLSRLANTSTPGEGHPPTLAPWGQKLLCSGPSQTSPDAPLHLAVHLYPFVVFFNKLVHFSVSLNSMAN